MLIFEIWMRIVFSSIAGSLIWTSCLTSLVFDVSNWCMEDIGTPFGLSSNQAPYTIATLNSWNLETALRYINFHSGYVNSSSKTVPLACETETYTSADSTDFASLYSSLPNFQVSASIWYKQFTSCTCDLVTVQEEYPGLLIKLSLSSIMLPPFCSSYMLSDMGIQKTQDNPDTECFIFALFF